MKNVIRNFWRNRIIWLHTSGGQVPGSLLAAPLQIGAEHVYYISKFDDLVALLEQLESNDNNLSQELPSALVFKEDASAFVAKGVSMLRSDNNQLIEGARDLLNGDISSIVFKEKKYAGLPNEKVVRSIYKFYRLQADDVVEGSISKFDMVFVNKSLDNV